jgi:glycosyltransferase involved in cell wall biosynthesis
LRESVRQNVNGLLVPPHDAQGFRDAIVDLVLDPARRRTLARAARLTAETRDVRAENDELLRQYAALAGTGIEVKPCAA